MSSWALNLVIVGALKWYNEIIQGHGSILVITPLIHPSFSIVKCFFITAEKRPRICDSGVETIIFSSVIVVIKYPPIYERHVLSLNSFSKKITFIRLDWLSLPCSCWFAHSPMRICSPHDYSPSCKPWMRLRVYVTTGDKWLCVETVVLFVIFCDVLSEQFPGL